MLNSYVCPKVSGFHYFPASLDALLSLFSAASSERLGQSRKRMETEMRRSIHSNKLPSPNVSKNQKECEDRGWGGPLSETVKFHRVETTQAGEGHTCTHTCTPYDPGGPSTQRK